MNLNASFGVDGTVPLMLLSWLCSSRFTSWIWFFPYGVYYLLLYSESTIMEVEINGRTEGDLRKRVEEIDVEMARLREERGTVLREMRGEGEGEGEEGVDM